MAPFSTRKNKSSQIAGCGDDIAKPLSVPEEFNLSQILNKLSTLSHELSVSLEQAKAEEKKRKKTKKNSANQSSNRSPLKPVNGRNRRAQGNVSNADVSLPNVSKANVSKASSSTKKKGQQKLQFDNTERESNICHSTGKLIAQCSMNLRTRYQNFKLVFYTSCWFGQLVFTCPQGDRSLREIAMI